MASTVRGGDYWSLPTLPPVPLGGPTETVAEDDGEVVRSFVTLVQRSESSVVRNRWLGNWVAYTDNKLYEEPRIYKYCAPPPQRLGLRVAVPSLGVVLVQLPRTVAHPRKFCCGLHSQVHALPRGAVS